MPKMYTFCFDVLDLVDIDERQAYTKGYETGLNTDYRSQRTIEKARSQVVATGLVAHERWEKTGEFKYVLLHEYIRGLNHGLEEKARAITKRRKPKV